MTKFEKSGLQALALAAGANEAHQEALRIARMIDELSADAHASDGGEPAMDIDMSTNSVVAADTGYMTDDAAAKAAQATTG
ncbi:hypothetical protein [Mycobacterium sp. AT1]|uniref:hypothetical protein n=1 Tax=Mycobacterium sp. AT1 TaxID=1961706 RepID=UPI0009AE98A6|nr:hypothetical protein [Mycobacterium sp. AT1]OPX07739.1 hypothetical protein B1790_21850 [Mycobacterium sp. AT1]